MIAAAPVWLAVGLLGGLSLPDARFADYRWNVDPRAAWGVETLAGRGRLAAGLRVAGSRTTQTAPARGGTSQWPAIHWYWLSFQVQ